MHPTVNLREVLVKIPEQMTKEEVTTIISAIYTQKHALGSHVKCEAGAEVADLLALKEPVSRELDDEYLPTCCRNGNSHRHPV